MNLLIPVIIYLALYGYVSWCRKGKGGKIGARIRASDHVAWRDAVNEANADLSVLERATPKDPSPKAWDQWTSDCQRSRAYLLELSKAEPKVFNSNEEK